MRNLFGINLCKYKYFMRISDLTIHHISLALDDAVLPGPER